MTSLFDLTIDAVICYIGGDCAEQQTTNFDVFREARVHIGHDVKLGKLRSLHRDIALTETA